MQSTMEPVLNEINRAANPQPAGSRFSKTLKGLIQRVFPFLRFIGSRFLAAVATFIIITAAIYAMSLIVPADDRARIYLSERFRYAEADSIRIFLDNAISKYGLQDPFLVQYGRWLGQLVHGDWGFSPILHVDVYSAIATRSPATLELTLYSILVYIPIGLFAGTFIAWRQGRFVDRMVRFGAYVVSAIPPFVLGLMLIAIIYAQLGLLDLSRIGYAEKTVIQGNSFFPLTGFITFDSLFNLRFDILWEAIRHLLMPVATLAGLNLATLILITRASVTEELQKEYTLVAKGMGLRDWRILFNFALRNALIPALTHSALTAAQLVTGVYVVEAIFNWHGVSELITDSMGSGFPDIQLALGFSVYSIIVVLGIVFVLDLVQGLVDPRVRVGKE
jgi:ABC-type dipeptide/oligopeptide/nickel transport system permease component